ncbi:LuxR C-terminal-related transcriptional regulator [Treponema sp. TIM-1]|uniref:helix-turn-helix transcriptional regulator n=1 Tax=Treponema sp. TIM-1 TaxID=2898417 RepID=UPI00397F5F9F
MNEDTAGSLTGQFFYPGASPVADNQIILNRPRIQQLMDQAVRHRLVTVVAGAGYGKTLAVYSYLRNTPFRTVWIHLSERDNNSWRFWENFVRAVAFLSPEGAAKMAENGFPETKGQFDRYLLIPQRNAIPDVKYVAVFDDFHLIHNEPVLNFLELSSTVSFRNLTSILISRKEPAINTVSLLSKGLLARITEDDLRFTPDEMIDYFRLEDITLPEEAARSLYRDTEGWAFAIHLAALALKKRADEGYSRGFLKFNIFNRIERELFSTISEKMQKYFIKFSLIEHLPLEFIKGISGGDQFIAEIEKIGSFVRYDPYLDAYRLHHLFQQYLVGKQDRLTAEEKKEVYLLAGNWCEKNGQKMDAIGYYEKAGAYTKLMEVVYTLPQVLPEHLIRFLLDIMDRAPEKLYQESPRAPVLHTRLLFTLGRLEEAAEEARGLIERFEALPPSVHNNRTLYGSYNNLGFIGMLSSPFTQNYEFPRFFEKAHHYYRLGGVEIRGTVTVTNLVPYACRVGLAKEGELDRYIQAMAAAEPHIVASVNGCICGLTDLARAEAAYFRGDLDNAVKFAYQALYKAQRRNQYEIETRSLFYLLRIALVRGRYTKIPELFKLLDAQLEVTDYVNRTVFYDIFTGWFYAHIGQTGKVAPWILEDPEDTELNFLMQGPEILTGIKGYLAEKRYDDALAIIENRRDSYGLGAYLLGRLEMKVLEAVCLYHKEKPEAAREALEAAYELARPDALDMPFIEMGNHIRPLILAALKDHHHRIPPSWLEMILKNASAYAKKVSVTLQKYREQESTPDMVLSSRERKVLIGLSQGLTRDEIARDRALSLNTVKMTIGAIYDKLGAVNRADAIRIATARGILKINNPDAGNRGL